MNHKKYNVLIVGAGKIGAFYDSPKTKFVLTHAHAFTQHEGFNLIGFVDTNFQKANDAAKLWGTRAFLNIDEAFSSEKIDVVCNSTPDEYHYGILNEILLKDVKIVFSEKPLTKNIAEAREIVKKSRRNKIPVVVNYRRRFVPEFYNLAREIKAGKFGDFISGTGYYGKGILHNGSHLIDLLRLLVGEVTISQIFEKTFDFTRDDPSLSAILKINSRNFYLNGIDSNLYTIFEIDLLFSNTRLRIIDSGNKIEKHVVVTDPKFNDHKNMVVSQVISTSLDMSMYFAVDNIYRYLKGTKKLLNPTEEGFISMETTDKILHQQ